MVNGNTFLGLITNGIRQQWNAPALTDYNSKTYLYKDVARKITELHILFKTLKLNKGDKIAICGRNSSNWVITFFAGMTYGAVVTTILHDFDTNSIHNIVNHSDAKVLFVAEHIWERIDSTHIPQVETIFLIDDFSILKTKNININSISENIENIFNANYPSGFTSNDLFTHQEQPNDLALLNYTSGTTSQPKGVMLSYQSLWSNTKFAIERIPFVKPGDGIVCMLPMAHMYGLAFEILLSIAKGCHINFLTRIPSPQVIMSSFAKVNPPLVLAVPLIIEKIVIGRVFSELKKQPVKTLIKIPIIKNKIYNKIRIKLLATFGNKLNEVVIGGAALNKEVGDFLTKIKFPYTVGYGMTECGPLISYEYWDTYKPSSCGRTVDRMEVKIEMPDPKTNIGEIYVRGDNTMIGYYKNPAATKDIFTDEGWLKTGDLGTIDQDGFINIKGRSKTMILGGSGQNIYPEEIEQLLNNTDLVSESIIVDRDGKLLALIYPDYEFISNQNIDKKELPSLLKNALNTLNNKLPKYSQITDFEIQEQEFEKTPKRSIKRYLYK